MRRIASLVGQKIEMCDAVAEESYGEVLFLSLFRVTFLVW